MFFYQPTFNLLELKEDKDTKYIISWKSKGVYNSKTYSITWYFFT